MRRETLLVLHCICTLLVLGLAVGEVTVVNNELEAQKPVQLTASNFDSEIRRVPSSYGLLVEFYAHW